MKNDFAETIFFLKSLTSSLHARGNSGPADFFRQQSAALESGEPETIRTALTRIVKSGPISQYGGFSDDENALLAKVRDLASNASDSN